MYTMFENNNNNTIVNSLSILKNTTEKYNLNVIFYYINCNILSRTHRRNRKKIIIKKNK